LRDQECDYGDGSVMTRIMIVGDSITEGSQGDYTWRYWLWRHLTSNNVPGLRFVGPRHGLDDLSESFANEDSDDYADAGFETAHDALWGQPYTAIMTAIEDHVREHQPDILLTLLGINDFAWSDETPFQVEQDMRIYIAEARRAKRELKFAFGRVLPTERAETDADFASRVSEFNVRLDKTAAELSLDFSPIVIVQDDDGFVPSEHTWDGTHPNTHGELRIAAAFADTMHAGFGLGAPYPRPLPDIADVQKSAAIIALGASALPGSQDAVERHVHDLADEPVGQRGVAVQQPVVERAVQQVQRHLDAGLGGDLAALDGAAEDGAGLVPARFH
jgi:lysophospholipase L1-like esterase